MSPNKVYYAGYYLHRSLQKVDDLMKADHGSYNCTARGGGFNSGFIVSASSKRALANRLARLRAAMTAAGFIPLMFELREWTALR